MILPRCYNLTVSMTFVIAEKRGEMAEKIRWGILSTANIGRKRVVPAMLDCQYGVVAGVASRNLDAAKDFAAEFNIPKSYGSYEELLADPEIDAIYNPLPNSMHAEWSIKAAEAGKPTLCEKPLASNAAEAQSMVDAFAARGVLFAEAFMYRFHPQTQLVKRMVEDGVIGDLRMIEAAFSFAIAAEDNIRLNKSLAGGGLMDVGCYCVNAIRLMSGAEPVEVKALAKFGEASGVDEMLTGIMDMGGSVMAHFDCSLRAKQTHTYSVRGTTGRIDVAEAFVMPPDRASIIGLWEGDNYREISVPPANSYTLMADDFAQALIDGRPPKYAPSDGVANMAVIDRLYESAGK